MKRAVAVAADGAATGDESQGPGSPGAFCVGACRVRPGRECRVRPGRGCGIQPGGAAADATAGGATRERCLRGRAGADATAGGATQEQPPQRARRALSAALMVPSSR